MENKSLLLKLYEELKLLATRSRSSIKKIVPKLCCALLSLSILFSSGCQLPNNNDDIVNSGEGNKDKENDYSQYSQILQNILTNERTRILIKQRDQEQIPLSSPYFKGIPFHFIEQQGHDVEAVKAGELSCSTSTFIKETEPNNLYMIVSVENDGGYYTQYLVKYSLTEQEIKDYKSMHGLKADWYYQAAFMNDEISKCKTPTILSEADITKEAHENLNSLNDGVSGLNSTKTVMGTNAIDVFLKDFNEETQCFNVYALHRTSSSSSTNIKGKFTEFPLAKKNQRLEIYNDVFAAPSIWGNFTLTNAFSLQWPTENVTVYDSDANYCESYCTDLVHELKYSK